MKKERGLSLIELMVSITVGIIVALGATMMILPISRTTTETVQASKMNTDARAVVDVMSNELRRAGYGVSGSAITVPTRTCIIYGYAESSGATPKWGAFEYTSQKSVRAAFNLDTRPVNCTSAISWTWQTITDPLTLEISEFEVRCLTDRSVTLMITARTPRDHRLSRASITLDTRNTTCTPVPTP